MGSNPTAAKYFAVVTNFSHHLNKNYQTTLRLCLIQHAEGRVAESARFFRHQFPWKDEFESDLQLFLPIEHTIILTEPGLVHNALLKIFTILI